MNGLDIKRAVLANKVKWGLGLAAALIISPIIFSIIQGLVGLAIAGTVGLAIINFAPVVAMKFVNWKIKAIKDEARKNPIETMEVITQGKREAFRLAEQKLTEKIGARNTFKRKAEQFAAQYPARADEFMSKLEAMNRSVEKSKKDIEVARVALANAEQKLVEMRAYWEMTQATIAANKAMDMDIGDIYAKMKEDTACDAVLSEMDRAFAELETDDVGSERTKFEGDLPFMQPEHVQVAQQARRNA